MKRISIYFSLLLLVFSSCSGFLDEEPRSEFTIDKYFTSPKHAHGAINSLYRTGVQNMYYAGSAYIGPRIMYGTYMTGFFDNPKYKGQEKIIVQCQELDLNPVTSAGYLDGIWLDCYRAIFRANNAIDKIPLTPGLTNTEKNQLLAQAYFFRAFNYLILTRHFGDVPLILDYYTEPVDEMYAPRTPSLDIYNQIIEDLTFAIEEGELEDLPMPKNAFRISKGSARALLADAYLTMSGYPLLANKYTEAAKVARDIINSNKYSLVQNVDKGENSAYNIIRTSDIQDEYLYTVEYAANIAENGWLPTYCFPNSATSWPGSIFKYSLTCDVYVPAKELLAIYDPQEDIRIQERQYYHSRFSYSYTDKNEKVVNNTVVFDSPLPFIWYDSIALFISARESQDMKVYRYAEVLLIAAEAIAQSEGVTQEAASYLAMVRSRASLTGKTEADIKSGLISLGKEEFIEEVWKERLREFSLEFKMWNDIQRTRKIIKTDVNNPGQVSFVNVIGSTNLWGKVFKERDLLFPISANEIQRNPALEQNAGYK